MRRREFITALGGAAATAAWPLTGFAQQPARPVIGYLSGATLEFMHDYVAAFHKGLADTGYVEGEGFSVEYQWAEGHNDRLPALAAELVRRQVNVIVVGGSTPGTLAAKAATQTIPVVFFGGHRPGQGWSRPQHEPAGRQYYRHHDPQCRVVHQMPRAHAHIDVAGCDDRGARQSRQRRANRD
jgi:ABC-type uncharacterized transport system substrate-binding protein